MFNLSFLTTLEKKSQNGFDCQNFYINHVIVIQFGKKRKKKGNIQSKLFEELQIKLNNIKYEILSFAFLHEYEVSFRKKKEKKSRICVYLQTIRTINHPYFPKKKKKSLIHTIRS